MVTDMFISTVSAMEYVENRQCRSITALITRERHFEANIFTDDTSLEGRINKQKNYHVSHLKSTIPRNIIIDGCVVRNAHAIVILLTFVMYNVYILSFCRKVV